MLILFYVAVFAGIMLYVAKLVSFYALLSPFPKFKKWLKAKPVRLAVIDIIFGIMGMHIVSLAAGSVSAMFIMIVFSACSILYLTIIYTITTFQNRKKVVPNV
jgi:hypothetical protein